MDFEALSSLYESSEAWRLLRSRSAPLVLSFLNQIFKAEEIPSKPAVEVEGALADYLGFYGLSHDPEDGEVAEADVDTFQKARLRIDKWTRQGWLRRTQDENGNDWLELTSDTEKALAFVLDLGTREFVGTESRLQDIFRKLEELVSGSQDDPKHKIKELKDQIKALEGRIRDIQRTGRVEAFSDTQIKERFLEVNKSARGLLSDFREVEKIFKQIVRDIYDRQAELANKRGELLGYALDQIEAMQDNDQGRSFYSFWEYLIDDQKQDQLRELVQAVFELMEERDIPVADRLLRNIKRFLFLNGQKVFDSNQLLAEKLNRIVAERNLRERKRALALIDGIRSAAQKLRESPPSAPDFWEVEESVEVSLPLERPLGQPPPKMVATQTPEPATESLEDADLSHLVDQFFVDQAALKQQIRNLLRNQPQVSLQQVLETYPVTQGLAEIMAYFSIASNDNRNFVDTEGRFLLEIAGPPVVKMELPKVIFIR